MTIGDLIKNKDYDYISYKMLMDIGVVFVGQCASVNGQLISLDGDTIYDEKDEVVRHKEFTNPDKGISNGLEVVIDPDPNW